MTGSGQASGQGRRSQRRRSSTANGVGPSRPRRRVIIEGNEGSPSLHWKGGSSGVGRSLTAAMCPASRRRCFSDARRPMDLPPSPHPGLVRPRHPLQTTAPSRPGAVHQLCAAIHITVCGSSHVWQNMRKGARVCVWGATHARFLSSPRAFPCAQRAAAAAARGGAPLARGLRGVPGGPRGHQPVHPAPRAGASHGITAAHPRATDRASRDWRAPQFQCVLTTERLFWSCGARTAERPEISVHGADFADSVIRPMIKTRLLFNFELEKEPRELQRGQR